MCCARNALCPLLQCVAACCAPEGPSGLLGLPSPQGRRWAAARRLLLSSSVGSSACRPWSGGAAAVYATAAWARRGGSSPGARPSPKSCRLARPSRGCACSLPRRFPLGGLPWIPQPRCCCTAVGCQSAGAGLLAAGGGAGGPGGCGCGTAAAAAAAPRAGGSTPRHPHAGPLAAGPACWGCSSGLGPAAGRAGRTAAGGREAAARRWPAQRRGRACLGRRGSRGGRGPAGLRGVCGGSAAPAGGKR